MNEDVNMSSPLVINATLFWAQLQNKNDLSGKFQVDLCDLSPKAVEQITQMGIEIVNKGDERANYITCKSQNMIRAYDTNGEEVGALVGNGTKAKAVIGSYDWTFKTKKGRSPSLQKLVITDLVVFDNDGAGGTIDLDEAV